MILKMFQILFLYTIFALCVSYINAVYLNTNPRIPFHKYWIVLTKVSNTPRIKRGVQVCEQLTFHLIHFTEFNLCVFRSNLTTYNFIDKQSELVIYEDNGNVHTSPYSKIDYVTISGFAFGYEGNSKVDGYLRSHRFSGSIIIGQKSYYVEDLARYTEALQLTSYDKDSSIVYEYYNFSLKCPQSLKQSINETKDSAMNMQINPFNPFSFTRPNVDYSSLSCSLVVLIDTAYYKLIMGADEQKTLQSVTQSIHAADSIFRSTDFLGNGKPSNVGFRVSQIHLFKASVKSPLPKFYPYKTVSYRHLEKFSTLELLNTANLGILYTGQRFSQNVAGLSYTAHLPTDGVIYEGGICFTNPLGPNRNALMVTARGYATGESQLMLDVTVTHELGHSFGARHDDMPQCGGHLMESRASNVMADKLYKFSPCSISDIHKVMTYRSTCFIKDIVQSFCGNGIVEKGEDCDCGSKYNCRYTRACCHEYDSQKGVPCTWRFTGYHCYDRPKRYERKMTHFNRYIL